MDVFSTPQKITGLTTHCQRTYLDNFLQYEGKNVVQPFEIYEGPPEFLPTKTPIFIFQRGTNHRLRAIARHAGWSPVSGWITGTEEQRRKEKAERVADMLLEFYATREIMCQDTREELASFCSRFRGVRGLFLFDHIIEIKYRSRKDWIKRRHVVQSFDGKWPYARGAPYRYLSEAMVTQLIQLILTKSANPSEIRSFMKEFLN